MSSVLSIFLLGTVGLIEGAALYVLIPSLNATLNVDRNYTTHQYAHAVFNWLGFTGLTSA
ncbi:MAG: hypothetical protein MRJ65_13430 [Candidatus Brocadiaceae bacterium]|nr:hypothetical protein [Candidatus Brocadiaceae bacterium]